MPLEVITVPCLEDNYAFIIRDEATGQTAVVDVPDAPPIVAELEKRGWGLDQILITHHHADHIDGVPELVEKYGPKVTGGKADAHRLPPLDLAVEEGDVIEVGESRATIIDVSGHTVGHIAIHFADAGYGFTADSLMALGCGRVFEGTKEQMWESLSKIAAWPAETIICSGHEYTASNAKFALTVEPDNPELKARVADVSERRAKGVATVPSTLSYELATNPFLRANVASMKQGLGMADASDAEVFAEIRRRKDEF